MRLSVPLAVALAALVAVNLGLARPPKHVEPRTPLSGGSARTGGRPNSPVQASTRGSAPSPFWRFERRYVAQQHRMGRLGAEVRRLRHENAVMRNLHKRMRTLQSSSDPVAVQAHAVIDGLLCVHGGEGAWDDPNAPYYGGIQMDATFQANYAPPSLRALGTADHWTPLEQLAVGVIGWSLQGHWAPWPRTSRACGLQ